MDFKDRIEMLLTLPDLYEESLVSRIDTDHHIRPISSVAEAFDGSLKTIKVEELERVFREVQLETVRIKKETGHDGPCNAHLFWAVAGAPSFRLHEDPYDILLKCVYGKKTIEIGGEVITLDPIYNPTVWIPAGVMHRATNEFESIMISFGNEQFLEDRWQL
jgi:mannose-6-phosphate isomerase-like protein (cupin superfamily)